MWRACHYALQVLRNLVSALPEITVFDLHPTEDWFVVLACDGVWDVVTDEEACVMR